MNDNRKRGVLGESIAVTYLQSKKYQVLEKNIYTPYGEIDIVAQDRECLVFIEVKLRRSKAYGDVLEQVTQKKKERIIQSAQYFLEQKYKSTKECRFDYIALYKEGEHYKITHIENAFEMNY